MTDVNDLEQVFHTVRMRNGRRNYGEQDSFFQCVRSISFTIFSFDSLI